MAKVTIVSDELSEEKVKQLQETADELTIDRGYSAHALMHYFGYHDNLTMSLAYLKESIIMNCRRPGSY